MGGSRSTGARPPTSWSSWASPFPDCFELSLDQAARWPLHWRSRIVEFVDRASQLMTTTTTDLPVYDRTARKAHQWTMVVLVAAGLILGGIAGALLLAVAGVIMLAGRFWWPADVVRQLVWRVLEPAGILKRDDVHEDHETRRIARALGGTIWLIAAASLLAGNAVLAWVLTLPIAVMVALDASVDFCALCFVVAQLNRRGILHRA